MGTETAKIEKENPTGTWMERRLGRAVFLLIPGVFLTFAGWIYMIGMDSTEFRLYMKQNNERWEKAQAQQEADKENQAQWNALMRVEEKSKNLSIEVELYKRMFYLMVDNDVDPERFHLERVFPKKVDDGKDELAGESNDEKTVKPKPVRVVRPIMLVPPRSERLKNFKQEQIEQIQRQQQYPNMSNPRKGE